jgi:hypothetical protein
MKNFLLFLLSAVSLFVSSIAPAAEEEGLHKIFSPYIEGDTLFMKGRVDSHFYDYLTYEAKKVKDVKYISFNSYGGNHNWGLEVARKIQELGKITILKKGNVCASACVYLFAAGAERVMESGTWLGVHGARLTGSYVSSFAGLCFVDMEEGSQFVEGKKGCKEFLATWYEKSLTATSAAFDFMEKSGVLPEMRAYYFSLDDDPLWYQQLNVFKKPDWVVTPEVAFEYNLATQVID